MTGLARESQRVADFVMVGLIVGPAAIAGMGFSLAYFAIALGVGFSLANGGMTFMSQRFGANDSRGFDLASKQTLWIELMLAFIAMAVFIFGAEYLIALLGAEPQALEHGVTYLQAMAFSLPFVVINHVASRTLFSANDAWTPMAARASGAVANIFLNAFFIIGLGLGVFGAALGTVIAEAGISVVLVAGLVVGRLPVFGAFPVRISITPPYFNLQMSLQIVEVASPLVARQVISRVAQIITLGFVAYFGTIVVAAYVAAREIRNMANTPGWGFGTAGRSLVGQELGANDEDGARDFGWDILRFAVAVFVALSVFLIVFSDQIATLFAEEPAAVGTTSVFVVIMAISLVGLGIDSTMSGTLTGAGDTRWPFYGRLLGLYVFMIPLAYLGTVTPLGIMAVYLAITAETIVPAIVTLYRFTHGEWIEFSRRYRSPS